MAERMPGAILVQNGEPVPVDEVPVLAPDELRRVLTESTGEAGRIAALFGHSRGEGRVTLYAVIAGRTAGSLAITSTEVSSSYPAFTPDCPQAHLFEREIAERWGINPEGHPWLKPVCFPSAGKRHAGEIDFFTVEGEGVHEVAVGPVHAGVIEPGHFRFQCAGEEVLHLEISLGYQHRGVEERMIGGPAPRTLHYAETVAGDTTIGHVTAYSEILEALAGCRVPPRAEALRGVALELERLANHVGDLGALAADTGYLPGASFLGRLRGEFLGMTALACGNRFGRSWVRPGGVTFDLDDEQVLRLQSWLEQALAHVRSSVRLLWDSPSVQARLEGVGVLTRAVARELGVVGLPARASGLERDVRRELPTGIWRTAEIPVSTWHTGDVFARAFVRRLEIDRSAEFIRERLSSLPGGEVRAPIGPCAPGRIVASLVEGWRGEIAHVAITGDEGRFARYVIVDPSFHNWPALAAAMRGQEISDFPLCNKSFNLSYCGHDR